MTKVCEEARSTIFSRASSLLQQFVKLLVGLLILAPWSLYAQETPKRLSDWMLEQPFDQDAYPLGLSWRVPGEVAPQGELRLQLLRMLSGGEREVRADSESLARLADWVRTLPVTGRVSVAVADARWLQANPIRDPVLQSGHSVVMPKRPRSVTVVTTRGNRCSVIHSPGHEAMTYVQACSPGSSPRADWAWMAQPDGRVQRFGVATWNREVQDEPAPGAWIWAPPRDGGWPLSLSQQLISFLATQGPAPDPAASPSPSLAVGAPKASTRAQDSVLGGASEAWTAYDLPELKGSVEGVRDRKVLAEGLSDAGSTSVLPAPTQVPSARSRGLALTASDWGGVGLLQTPTARMEKAGHLTANFSRIYPYLQGNIMFQPLDWLEAGFRYTNVSNVLYSPDPNFSGDQADKDKSLDAKFRLWSESAHAPEVALGLRDIAGTGIFSGEYLVASKRTGPFDWSLGLGWGNVGARGNIRNPLGFISPKFNTRNISVGEGGNFSFGSYFRGRAALFGGVQYQTPWEPLLLKLEHEGNNYQHEGLGNILPQRSPWNFGLVYRAARTVDVSLGVERGNTAMLGVTLHTQLDGLSMPKLSDAQRVAVTVSRPQLAPDWSATSRDIALQTDWHVHRIEQRGRELRVMLDDAEAVYWQDRVDRAASVLNRDAPASVDRFALAYRQRGIDMAEHVIDRDAWVAQQTQALPPREQRDAIIARAPAPPTSQPPQAPIYQDSLPMLETGLGPYYQQSLGGPDAFLLFQAGVAERVKLRLRDDTWLQGVLQLGLIDNYNKFRFKGSSDLPRVRTFVREYVTTSKLMLPNLQATHVGKLGENQYYSVYGGYLESMFAGVGGEWLYRPFASRIAFGVDVNAVQQRNFAQDFGFGDAGSQTRYRVATGHATLYWDTGWNNVQADLSAGRYLAKDLGVTVGMSRAFDNGVKVGAFFSKTNVSAAQFGEGSFDKGVYLSVPFDAFLTRSSGARANVLWKPLTRDGAAKLSRGVELYNLTSTRDDRTLHYKAAPPPNHESIPPDRRESWSPPPQGPEPYTRVTPRPATGQWASDAPDYEQRLVEALHGQRFRNIRVAYDATRRLTVTLSNDSLRPISRAVGRAARTALPLAPLETRQIRIVFAEGVNPVATYDFFDLVRLDRYFGGSISQAQLADSVVIDYRDRSAREQKPLAWLDDVDTRAEVKGLDDVLLPGTRALGRIGRDLSDAARTAADTNWLRMGVFGTGLVLASSAFDRRADQFATDHGQNRWVKRGNSFGNALPWLAIAGAGVAALDGSDPARSRTGYAAIEAGGTAFLAVEGLKYVVGRSRPGNELGNHSFKSFSNTSGYDSFPSGHTIISWAVATPFAEEYNAPWLYGLAAVTNLARAGSRQHWVSDTVAGSVLGYAIGRVFWDSSRSPKKGEPRVMIHPKGVNVAWEFN